MLLKHFRHETYVVIAVESSSPSSSIGSLFVDDFAPEVFRDMNTVEVGFLVRAGTHVLLACCVLITGTHELTKVAFVTPISGYWR